MTHIAQTDVIDLTKILAEVGKISESIDEFATQEIPIPIEAEEELSEQNAKIQGLKKFFDEEE